jgi:kumamolisin
MHMSDQPLVAISASHRDPLPGARRVADIPGDAEIQFSIVVRRKAGGEDKALRAAAAEPSGSMSERRRRLAEEAGAGQEDLDRVTQYVTGAGMQVESADAATRSAATRPMISAIADARELSRCRPTSPTWCRQYSAWTIVPRHGCT